MIGESKVKTAAVICEYNPFHNGHKYQLDMAKKLTECSQIAVLMSGNYVQRGDFAIYSKSVRAKAALANGADLVIENPSMFVLRSAEGYAHAAVYTLNSLGCIDFLVFGAETDDMNTLKNIAALLSNETPRFQTELKAFLAEGLPYPAARSKATDKLLGKYASDILKQPNNLLAVEYLKALIKLKSDIKPVLIPRSGAAHHSDRANGCMASASFIRTQVLGGADFSSLVPDSAAEIYKNAEPFIPENADKSILAALCLMTRSELASVPDISEGLENKIKKELSFCTSADELILAVKSKRYTYSRIKRSILCAFLRICSDDASILPKYIKILDFNDRGRQILNYAKKTASLPLAKNAAAVLRDEAAMSLWKRELDFDRVYEILH